MKTGKNIFKKAKAFEKKYDQILRFSTLDA
jgi:hypothetical protein